jgi:hypothetical protein
VVSDATWFWDVVGTDEEQPDLEESRPLALDRPAWLMLLAPVGAAVLAALAYLVHVAAPGWSVLLAALTAGVALAVLDHKGLATQGVEAPHVAWALLPPAYLLARGARTGDHRLLLAWFPFVAAGALLLALASDRLAPAGVDSAHVERALTRELLAGTLPVRAETGTVSCPGFEQLWPGEAVRCTAQDASGQRVSIEVSPSGRHGAIDWQVLAG